MKRRRRNEREPALARPNNTFVIPHGGSFAYAGKTALTSTGSHALCDHFMNVRIKPL